MLEQEDYYNLTFEDQDIGEKRVGQRRYEACSFLRCNFSGADLAGCRFIDCAFVDCNLSNVRVNDAAFQTVRFDESKIMGVDFSVVRDFMLDLDFSGCDVSYCVFSRLSLDGITFTACQLSETQFESCELAGADFSGSRMPGTRFQRCKLSGADFRTAETYAFDPRDNVVTAAKFSLPDVVGLLDVFEIVIE